MKSLELYNLIIKKFPKSSYSDDAIVKLGEYFYARGLYSQACKQLAQFPRKHPRFYDMQRVIDLLISSFQAVGQAIQHNIILVFIKVCFPYLDVQKYGINTLYVNNFQQKKKKISEISSICNSNWCI